MTCSKCGTGLFPRERHTGTCIRCDQPALKDAPPPYPDFCRHPERCSGFSSCPRDLSCVD